MNQIYLKLRTNKSSIAVYEDVEHIWYFVVELSYDKNCNINKTLFHSIFRNREDALEEAVGIVTGALPEITTGIVLE